VVDSKAEEAGSRPAEIVGCYEALALIALLRGKPMETENWRDFLVLTPVETARLLRISRGTAYAQIRLGVIPSIKCGRRILVPRAALMRMLEEAKGDRPQS